MCAFELGAEQVSQSAPRAAGSSDAIRQPGTARRSGGFKAARRRRICDIKRRQKWAHRDSRRTTAMIKRRRRGGISVGTATVACPSRRAAHV